MNKHILVALVMFTSLSIYGQTQEDKPAENTTSSKALEITAGYSMPLGAFAETDIHNDKSGYASGGWHIQASFSRVGAHNLGLGVQYTYQQNATQNPASNVYPFGMPDSLDPRPWSNHLLLAGPVYLARFGRVLVDAKVMGGVMISASPVFDTPKPGATSSQDYNTNVATGFAIQASGGVGYYLTEHMAIKLNLGILGGWPGETRSYPAEYLGLVQWKDPVTGMVFMKPVYSDPMEFEIKKVVTTFNLSAGIVYRF